MSMSFSSKDLIGNTQTRKVALEKIYIKLCENDSENVNYNRNGELDGVGFVPISSIFIDNFLIYCPVPEQFVDTTTGGFLQVGPVLSNIWQILKEYGLLKSRPKTLRFLRSGSPGKSHRQIYKVSCSDENPANVMKLLHDKEILQKWNLYLAEVDATMDLAGSFDKRLLEECLLLHGFQMEGTNQGEPRTIVDNDYTVGKNCFSYMEHGRRYKLYNRFVQSMEINALRDRVGNHIHDWVVQEGTKLATARDAGVLRGTTQAEITFYTDNTNSLPTIDIMESLLMCFLNRIPKALVYSTPIKEQWFALCDTFKHTLILEDPEEDKALVGLFINSETQRISGKWVSNYAHKRRWCEEKLTLQSHLPIDVVSVGFKYEKCDDKEMGPVKLSSITLHANRKYKLSTTTTRIMTSNVFYHVSRRNNDELVQRSGLYPHANCTLELSNNVGISSIAMAYIEDK